MNTRLRSVATLAAGVLALCSLTIGAVPASGASSGGRTGAPSAGSNCGTTSCDAWALLGAVPPSSTGNTGVLPPPPPCQVAPVGNAQAGSAIVIAFYQASAVPVASSSAAPAGALSPQDASALSHAQQLVNENPVPAGEWYQVVPTVPADTAQCDQLPLYIWQAGNGIGALRQAGLPIPVATLASLLYRKLTLARVASVTLSPKAASDTNLPTSVQLTLAPAAGSPLFLTAQAVPYVMASASSALGVATVWAKVTSLTINPGTGTTDATTYDGTPANPDQCIEAHPGSDGRAVMLGSRLTAAQVNNIGPGGADGDTVDCGVTYLNPGSYQLTVSVNWNACWVAAPPTTAGPPADCGPVSGSQGLQASASGPVTMTVRSIVANNG